MSHAHNRAGVNTFAGRTNGPQTATSGGRAPSGSPSTPIATGPAASGAGSHAAAQAASEERRRLEGSSTRRPEAGQSRRMLFVEHPQRGEEIRRGRGVAVAAASSESDNPEVTSPPSVKPSDSTTSSGDTLLAPHGKVTAVSPAAEDVEAAKRNRVHETGAGGAGPLTGEESEDPREAAKSAVGGEGVSTEQGGRRKDEVMLDKATVDGTTVRSASGSSGAVDASEAASKRLLVPSAKTSASDGTKPSTVEKSTTAGTPPASPPFIPPGPRSRTEPGDQTAVVGGSPETRTGARVLGRSGPNQGAEDDGENAAATKSAALTSTGKRSGDFEQEGGVDAVDGTTALFQPSLPSDAAGSAARSGQRESWSARPAGTVRGVLETTAIGEGLGGGSDEPAEFAEDSLGVAYLGGMDEEELEEESEKLKRESNRAQRDAETVTDEMKEEVRVYVGCCEGLLGCCEGPLGYGCIGLCFLARRMGS